MDTSELMRLAERTRLMREGGIALIMASGLLALLLFIPARHPIPAPQTAEATTTDAFTSVVIEARSAIVYDLATGQTLFAKNADAQLPLASLTKLLTVYAALAMLPSETLVSISADAARLEAPRAFTEGQTFELGDLARLTLTASLNDGAAAIAEAAAGYLHVSQDQMLAGAASALRLSQTYAVNGSGLDVSTLVSGGYGSATDLARLAGALAAQAPEIASATTRAEAQATSAEGKSLTVRNTDPIVATVPHILLSKTGYTDLAGGNLALVFDVGIGHPVAIVILGSSKQKRFTDGSRLVAATFAHFALAGQAGVPVP